MFSQIYLLEQKERSWVSRFVHHLSPILGSQLKNLQVKH